MASMSLIATCIYLLIKDKAGTAIYPAMGAGILGYVLLVPGKRTARVSMGGVVLDIMSDDTGVINTTVQSAVSHISQEISEKTRSAAIESAKTGDYV